MTEQSRQRPAKIGRVVSNKMQKTVVVAIERIVPHPMYRKLMRRITTLRAHDEQNECHVGDRVKLVETRPLSKSKRWRVVQILRSGDPQQ